MTDYVGPFAITSAYQSCSLCKHHNQTLWRTLTHYYCQHPGAKTERSIRIELQGRYIGQSSDTPQWCPVLNTVGNEENEE